MPLTPAHIADAFQTPSPAPQILPKLIGILQDPNSDATDLAKLIKTDIALASEVLRLANSAYYGSTHASSIDEAIAKVGFNEIYRLSTHACAGKLLNEEIPLYSLEQGDLWRHSLITAYALHELARILKAEGEEYYTVGLLHSIGRVALNSYHIQIGLPNYIESNEVLTPHQEYQLFQFTDADIAAQLLGKWNFPDVIKTPIAYQHNPPAAPASHQTLTQLLYIVKDGALATLREEMSDWTPPAATAVDTEDLLRALDTAYLKSQNA